MNVCSVGRRAGRPGRPAVPPLRPRPPTDPRATSWSSRPPGWPHISTIATSSSCRSAGRRPTTPATFRARGSSTYDDGALAAPMDHSGNDPGSPDARDAGAPRCCATELAALGISDNSRIVVVPVGQLLVAVDARRPDARLRGALERLVARRRRQGLDRRRASAVDRRPGRRRPARSAPLKIRPVVVDAEFVRAHIGKPGFAIVDARSRNFYDGVPSQRAERGPPPKLGHIPGAVSAPFNEFATHDGGRHEAEVGGRDRGAVRATAGVKPGDTIIGYCHIGQQATAMLFAARTLGHKVLLYDGSFRSGRSAICRSTNPSAQEEPVKYLGSVPRRASASGWCCSPRSR